MANHTSPNNYLVVAPPAPKIVVPVLNGGANRGALLNIVPAYLKFNNASERAIIRPDYVDPVPGRAQALKEKAEVAGVVAGAIEGRVEDVVLAQGADSRTPIVLNLDRASAIASVLRTTAGTSRATLGYLLLVTPNGQLWGIRFVIVPGDEASRAAAAVFFEQLAQVTERNASDVVIGAQADPSHGLIEPAIRRWFSEHTTMNLMKIVAGVEPVSNNFEITTDGEETRPMFIAIRDAFSDPTELAWGIAANPNMPLRKGVRFVAVEVTPGRIRFHEVRRRTDDRITVGGAEVIDHATVIEARRRELQRQAEQALARAERQTLSMRNPVWTTD